MVQLANFVSFQEARGPTRSTAIQRQRKVTVVGNLADYPLERGHGECAPEHRTS